MFWTQMNVNQTSHLVTLNSRGADRARLLANDNVNDSPWRHGSNDIFDWSLCKVRHNAHRRKNNYTTMSTRGGHNEPASCPPPHTHTHPATRSPPCTGSSVQTFSLAPCRVTLDTQTWNMKNMTKSSPQRRRQLTANVVSRRRRVFVFCFLNDNKKIN